MPTITCFQHVDNEGPGTLLEVLNSKQVDLRISKPFKGEAIPEFLGDGLIVLGGPMGVYERARYPWMEEELKAIRFCLDRSIPVLGICLGSQMLAHAAGAQVYRGALPEVGWYPLHLTPKGSSDPLLLGLPVNFEVFHWHNDTFTLPPNANLLGESEWYPHQIFKVGLNAYGFQCHLEITEEMARDWGHTGSKDLTPQGGPTRPERIYEGLGDKSVELKRLAEKVFTRFCALL